MPYIPEAQRSRLPGPDFKAYYVNRSIVELGDRSVPNKKQWVTTTRNYHTGLQPVNMPMNNPGITAFNF